MDISALSGTNLSDAFSTQKISTDYDVNSDLTKVNGNQQAFQSVFQSAVDMVNETNGYSNAAEEEEIKYAMGESDNIHDLQIAQQKANVSLQYTVSVRNACLDAYKEIMNLQF